MTVNKCQQELSSGLRKSDAPPMGDSMDDTERTIRRFRVDARAMQEEAEAAVAELAMATRTLRDAVLDHARSGATMRVEIGTSVLSGRVLHVGSELVRLAVADGAPIDVALEAISLIRVLPADTGRATVTTGHPETMLARCRELVQVNAEVDIGLRAAATATGALLAATSTHLELASTAGGTLLIPMTSLGWIGPSER